MLCDYHIHTALGGDAEGDFEDYIAVALEKGLSEIGFSGHSPQYFLPPAQRTNHSAIPEEKMDYYVEKVQLLRDKYRGSCQIRLGMEVDYIPAKEELLFPLIERYPWDYLYLSVHYLGSWPFDDPKYMNQYRERKIEDIYRGYYQLLIQGIKTGWFNVVAHFDLPKKFGFRPQVEIEEEKQALAACQEQGMAIELNTSGLRKPVKETYPSFSILQKANQFGLPICLGSDAHRPEEVGYNFSQALELLNRAGFKSLVCWEKREKIFYPIKNNNGGAAPP